MTLDESPKKLKRNVAPFDWDLDTLEAEKKIILLDILEATSARPEMIQSDQSMTAGLDIDSIISQITNAINEIGATRLVLDSLSILNLHAQNEAQIRIRI